MKKIIPSLFLLYRNRLGFIHINIINMARFKVSIIDLILVVSVFTSLISSDDVDFVTSIKKIFADTDEQLNVSSIQLAIQDSLAQYVSIRGSKSLEFRENYQDLMMISNIYEKHSDCDISNLLFLSHLRSIADGYIHLERLINKYSQGLDVNCKSSFEESIRIGISLEIFKSWLALKSHIETCDIKSLIVDDRYARKVFVSAISDYFVNIRWPMNIWTKRLIYMEAEIMRTIRNACSEHYSQSELNHLKLYLKTFPDSNFFDELTHKSRDYLIRMIICGQIIFEEEISYEILFNVILKFRSDLTLNNMLFGPKVEKNEMILYLKALASEKHLKRPNRKFEVMKEAARLILVPIDGAKCDEDEITNLIKIERNSRNTTNLNEYYKVYLVRYLRECINRIGNQVESLISEVMDDKLRLISKRILSYSSLEWSPSPVISINIIRFSIAMQVYPSETELKLYNKKVFKRRLDIRVGALRQVCSFIYSICKKIEARYYSMANQVGSIWWNNLVDMLDEEIQFALISCQLCNILIESNFNSENLITQYMI